MADEVLVNGDSHKSSNKVFNSNVDKSIVNGEMDMFSETWGFNLDDLYKIAVVFFKEKNGSKALVVGYKDKLRLVALTKQVHSGPFNASTTPAVGLFDVVGSDRRLAWQSLGNMSKEDAMKEFISFLRRNCSLFAPYVQAKFAEKELQENKSRELDGKEERISREEVERLHADANLLQEEDKKRQLTQEMMIRTALNQSTAVQFKQYAEQQFPFDPAQQEVLVRQLQDQHYIQYMQQLYSQQLLQQQALSSSFASPSTESSSLSLGVANHEQSSMKSVDVVESHSNDVSTSSVENRQNGIPPSDSRNVTNSSLTTVARQMPNSVEKSSDSAAEKLSTTTNNIDDDLDSNDLPPIAAASMWTRKELNEFRDSIKNDSESVIKVGSGEIVTVRVPTHEDGSCLFWEFATDSFDIGFGVYFEWTAEPSNQMCIVTESSEDDEEDNGHMSNGDAEAGNGKAEEPEVPAEEIVPSFRRECHKEVYCGSHVYPGRGVYLLKFDNSYSLWRGKTLYYRVYYTR